MINITLQFVLPLIIIIVSLLSGKIRLWLEWHANNAIRQGELVEMFQRDVSSFLRSSDSVKHSELREILCWSGHRMMDGSKLIRSFVVFHQNAKTSDFEASRKKEPILAFEGLPEDAQHSFARAMAYAFMISSYQSILFGGMYRSVLSWVVGNKSKEIQAPDQVVYRYRRVKHSSKMSHVLADA